MRKISYLLLIAAVSFSACKNNDFKKGGEGMEYKIITEGSGDKIKSGEYMEFNLTAKVARKNGKDTMLNNSYEQGAPQIIVIDSAQLPPAYYKLFLQLRKGDSLATRTLADSFFKKNPDNMPPFIKKGDYLETNIRVTNIYKTKEEADKAHQAAAVLQEAAEKKKAEALKIADDKTLTDYFAKNNIKAVKTPLGAYLEILQPGSGPVADTTNFMKINYTGRTLDGKMFDSNTDPSKGHVEPLTVNLTNNMSLGNGVIPGMSEALRMLNKGAKAKLYIPSGLAYGPRGAGADIAPNSNLVFDVEVLDLMTTSQAAAERAAEQKKMEEMQKKYADSMSKIQKPANK